MRTIAPWLLVLSTGCALGCIVSCTTGCTVEGKSVNRSPDASTDATNDIDVEAAADGDVDALLEGDVDALPDAMLDAEDADTDVSPEAALTGSCATATEVQIPAVGEATATILDLVGADGDLTGTCGGPNVERVLRLQATEDVTLLITAGGPESFSPVLYVLSDQCESAPNAQELACLAGEPGIQVMTKLDEGRTYFIVVDSNGASPHTKTILTILRLV